MKVSKLLRERTRKIVTIGPDAGVVEAMDALIANRISCLPVLGSSGDMVGIISDKDVFIAAYKHQTDLAELKVADLMTSDLIIGLLDDELDYIAGLITQNRIRHIPILDRNKLVGLISQGDVLGTLTDKMAIENRYLRQYLANNCPS